MGKIIALEQKGQVIGRGQGVCGAITKVQPGGMATLPEAERAKLRPGIVYTWVVLGDGSPLPARTFEIRR